MYRYVLRTLVNVGVALHHVAVDVRRLYSVHARNRYAIDTGAGIVLLLLLLYAHECVLARIACTWSWCWLMLPHVM